MHIIVAFFARKTLIQYTQCGEWNHKKDNYTKRTQCFYCGSNKYSLESYCCQKKDCQERSQTCIYLPKYIVCNGLNNVDYIEYLLRPVYSKAKRAINMPSGAEVSQIKGQQKVLRTRLICNNWLQAKVTSKSSDNPTCLAPANFSNNFQHVSFQ